MENYNGHEFVNVGVGADVSIKQLAEIVAEATAFKGELVFNTSKPDGTPRKLMDVSKLNGLGWKASTSLEEGIKMVYEETDFRPLYGFWKEDYVDENFDDFSQDENVDDEDEENDDEKKQDNDSEDEVELEPEEDDDDYSEEVEEMDEELDEIIGKGLGAKEYIKKPFTFQELKRVVEKHI